MLHAVCVMTLRGKSHSREESVLACSVVVTLLLTHLVPSLRPWSAKRWDGILSEIGIWNPKSTLSITVSPNHVRTFLKLCSEPAGLFVELFEFDFGTACVRAPFSLKDDVVDLDCGAADDWWD
jgi:hypothetical protein